MDCNNGDKLVVSWHGLELYGWPADADPPDPDDDLSERYIATLPFTLAEGESLMQWTGVRSRPYEVGSTLEFSGRDLSEIGLTFTIHATDMVHAVKNSLDRDREKSAQDL